MKLIKAYTSWEFIAGASVVNLLWSITDGDALWVIIALVFVAVSIYKILTEDANER